MSLHIDSILQQVKQAAAESNKFAIQLDDSWHQGRTIYGGVVAAMLLQALSASIDDDRQLVSLSVNFTGPQDGYSPIEISTSILRSGKSVTQATAQSTQNGKISTNVTACFAKTRTSAVNVASKQQTALRAPESCFRVSDGTGVPAFLQHLDLAVSDGEMPYSGSDKSSLSGWMRYRKASDTFSMVHLVGLIDAWPPTVLQMMPTPAPASTMTWNINFPNQIEQLDHERWLGYVANTESAGEGYAHTTAKVYSPEGQLLAISQQSIAIFA